MDRQTMSVRASVPRLEELRCMVGKVNSTETENLPDKSLYGPIFKCRLVIYALPEVLASPTNNADGNIRIVTTVDLFKTDKVRNILADMNIQCLGFAEVTRQVYEACLNYTLLFNVAPAWNKVDDYLLQGRDFLTSSNRLVKAVKLNAVVTDEETRFLVSPASIRLPRLTLEYFSLPPRVIEKFVANDTGVIEFRNPKSRAWVYVLPRMKRGRVMSVSKKMPEPSPFANYQQLRRHWKNMYGYRLPEGETGLIYYQVYFPWALGQACYTYPSCCLSPGKLAQFRLDDATNTAEQFLRDLTGGMPKICGFPLKLRELRFCTGPRHFQEDDQKENISNNRSRTTENFDEIWNLQTTPYNVERKTTVDSISPENRINRFPTSCNDFEQKNSSKLSSASNRNAKRVCSPQPVKSKIDESPEERTGRDEEESFVLLRGRSSFEFDELGKALDCKDLVDGIMGENLTADLVENDMDDEEPAGPVDGAVEVRSRFFDDPRIESHDNVRMNSPSDCLRVKKSSNQSTSPLNKVKLYRLSDKKLPSSRISAVSLNGKDRLTANDFGTRDISSYFTQRKRVRISHAAATDVESSDANSVQLPSSAERVATGREEVPAISDESLRTTLPSALHHAR